MSNFASFITIKLKTILSAGLNRGDLLRTLCIGLAIGSMPLLWGTSFICMIVSSYFRINPAVLQAVNCLLYPLHLALLMPFFNLGSRLFPLGPVMQDNLIEIITTSPQNSIQFFFWFTLKATGAWLATVLPFSIATYCLLLRVYSNMEKHIRS
ncbi:MAG TPA: DUF2062 domain-containing protein [Desulfuromonadales bacterium]|nr:DUF2062 domain-containing protein [Desulfuromonadales bacterium]